MTSIDAEEVGRVERAWKEAEARLKRTEFLKATLTVPAVNELRYAGYHLLQGLAAADATKRSEHFHRGQRHCERDVLGKPCAETTASRVLARDRLDVSAVLGERDRG